MYSLPYGRSSLRFPDLWNGRAMVITPGPFPDDDPAELVEKALDKPVDGPCLEAICSPGDRIVCVIPDLTRRAAVSQYLPILAERLDGIGIRPENMLILVALGIHRSLSAAELRMLTGKEVFRKYVVRNHEADNAHANVLLGKTSAGIPVHINIDVAKADHVLLTGGVTYHYFAGYGGGRKSLLPGVASSEACEEHHRMVVSWRKGDLGGSIGPGILRGNPVHEQMIQACSFLSSIFVLNVVTEPGGRIIAATAGELEAAHMDACRSYNQWFKWEMAGKSNLVIAGSGGAPKDVNFVQSHKSLRAAHRAVTDCGVLILAAQCSEGLGHPDMMGWFEKCRTEEQWFHELETGYQVNGQTAFSTWLCANSVPTILISEIEDADVEILGMIPAKDMDQALEAAKGILGELPVPVIIPDAGDILPVIKEV